MARTPTSGIATAIEAVISQPGYLVRITTASAGTFYMCSLDVQSSYDGHIWVPTDLRLDGINWTGQGRSARLTLGDNYLVWWVMALQLQLQDSQVDVWQCYADAANEAEALWRGRIGAIRKLDMAIECDLIVDTSIAHSPRRRVQSVVSARYLLPAGKVINIGGQKWVIERKTNG